MLSASRCRWWAIWAYRGAYRRPAGHARELVQLKNSLGAIETLKAAGVHRRRPPACAGGADRPSGGGPRAYRPRNLPDPQNNPDTEGRRDRRRRRSRTGRPARIALHGKFTISRIQQREARLRHPVAQDQLQQRLRLLYRGPQRPQGQGPETWIRKQTLANAERYITGELKEYEEKFSAPRRRCSSWSSASTPNHGLICGSLAPMLRDAAGWRASTACNPSLAWPANAATCVRSGRRQAHRHPSGRHPVIETLMPVGEEYILNDVMLDDKQAADHDDHRTQHVG